MAKQQHVHRDLYIPVVVALLTVAGGGPVGVYIAQRTNPDAGIVIWPFIVIFGLVALLGLYMFLALVFSWPLPGGLAPQDEPADDGAVEEAAMPGWTYIPPGHNAIVSGERLDQPGEWVPPGFHVKSDQGAVSDDRGNAILGGQGNRIYGGEGNTVSGSMSQVGQRPY